ncbi:MAG: ABC transporter permease [Deltaproteobacteria bacterium]|nr:ABC transporter permease [Deltaproteobacteria bacterium]
MTEREQVERAGIWSRLRRDRWGFVALMTLLGLLGVAVFGDLLASDLPVVLRFHGQTYLLPALTRPAALRAYDNQRLRREVGAKDWAWFPLCEYGAEQQPPIVSPPPASPSARHWLGTDDRGRDVFARLIHGSRVSLAVGFVAVAIYVLIGLFLGLLAGYHRGRVDWVISRVIELGLTFPTFFLILTVMALLGRTSVWTMALVIGLTRWTGVARLVRAEVLRLRELDFIAAARVAGASSARIMLRHLLPNALAPVLVNATFGVASVILVESALSFLGFGTPPPTASWGEVLGQAYDNPHAWWLVVFPGLLLFIAISAINRLGQGLHDALDARRGVEKAES